VEREVSMRILVVDDDANTCKAISLLLRASGYEVDTRDGPETALDALRASSYDVLVTDHVMGEMTGLDLARESRLLQATIRCIVVSGHPAPPDGERAHVTWIEKPIDADALIDAIHARATRT